MSEVLIKLHSLVIWFRLDPASIEWLRVIAPLLVRRKSYSDESSFSSWSSSLRSISSINCCRLLLGPMNTLEIKVMKVLKDVGSASCHELLWSFWFGSSGEVSSL